jgi:hypothetical protein
MTLLLTLALLLPNPDDDALKLSHDQKVALRDLRDEARAQQQKIRADIDLAEIELRRELEKDSPDEKRVAGAVDKISGFEAQARKTQILAWLKMRGLLSKDQRKKLETMRGSEYEELVDPLQGIDGANEQMRRAREAWERAVEKMKQDKPRMDRDMEKMRREIERMHEGRGSGMGHGSRSEGDVHNGTLSVNTIPAARVLIDGKEIGMTPLIAVSLSPGMHKVQMIAGDRVATDSIVIASGQDTRITKRFEEK